MSTEYVVAVTGFLLSLAAVLFWPKRKRCDHGPDDAMCECAKRKN